jgi:hypothetical protein
MPPNSCTVADDFFLNTGLRSRRLCMGAADDEIIPGKFCTVRVFSLGAVSVNNGMRLTEPGVEICFPTKPLNYGSSDVIGRVG